MQPNIRVKRGLSNYAGSTAVQTVITDSLIAGHHCIVDGVSPYKTLAIPPIPKGSIISINFERGKQEKVQYVTIGTHSEVIVASTRYTVGIQFPKDRVSDSATRDTKIFAYVSPATLSGTAATDRTAVYTALMNKINAYVPMYTKAKLATLFNFKGATTVTTAGFAAGDIWYVGANLSAATWVGFVAKATGALANATNQNVLLVTLSGTFPSAPTTDVFKAKADDAVQSVADAGSTYTAGQGLVVYDEGGYFSWREKLGRGGAPYIFSSPTFLQNRPIVLQAAQESVNWANDMLLKSPEFDLTRQNVDRGDILSQYTTAPTANASYTRYIFKFRSNTAPNSIDGAVTPIVQELEFLLKETTTATAYADGASDSTVHAALIALT